MKKIFTPLEISKTKKDHKENKSLTGFKDPEGKQASYWAGKRITIMGLGLHGGGVGTTKFFCRQGAKVLVTDLRTKKQLKESIQKLKGLKVKYVLARHRAKDFINTDLIIKNPGVADNSSYLKIAKKNGIPIETDVGLFFELSKAPIIGITGTKGKSTVANLLYLFLKGKPRTSKISVRGKYPKVILAGNIGTSPLESLKKITPPRIPSGSGRASKKSIVILELSSFQLEGLKKHQKSPQIALITNIYPDHLNRYKNLKEYIETKKIIFQFQKPKDIVVFNYDNLYTRNLANLSNSKVYFFSQKNIPPRRACFIKNGKIFFAKEKNSICHLKNLRLEGEHNISNILAAISAAKLLKVPSKNIKKVLKNIKNLPGRQEYIGEIKKVKYFNDTTATMPQATIAAIKTFSQRSPQAKIILIAGGQDKKLNYKSLAKEISRKINRLIFLPGTASDKIKKELSILNTRNPVKISFSSSMKEAVKKASKIAQAGDIVLLSPAAASFNLFKNEFDRGEQFVKNVRDLNRK